MLFPLLPLPISSTFTSLPTELGSSRQLAAPFPSSSSLKYAAHIINTSLLSILSSIPCHLEYHIFATIGTVLPPYSSVPVGGCSPLSLMPSIIFHASRFSPTLQSFTSWDAVAAPPVGRDLSCAARSCRWFCGSLSSGRTCRRPPTRSSSTSPPVLALPCSLFPIQIFLCFLRPLAQPHRWVHWNRPQRTALSDHHPDRPTYPPLLWKPPSLPSSYPSGVRGCWRIIINTAMIRPCHFSTRTTSLLISTVAMIPTPLLLPSPPACSTDAFPSSIPTFRLPARTSQKGCSGRGIPISIQSCSHHSSLWLRSITHPNTSSLVFPMSS